jgi:signal transduction histidine kinase
VVRWTNDELLRLFGREAEGFVDHPFLEKAAPEARERFGSLLRQVLTTGEPYQASAMAYTLMRGGQRVETFWDVSYVPVPGDDGTSEGVLVFALEVSDRVANERSQHERIDQLSQLDRLKDDFLSALSAQLATPINAVVGLASVLEEGAVGGQLKPEQQAYLQRILAMCHVQLALVNDLLDMGRFSAGKLALERDAVDLVRASDTVVSALKPLMEQQGQRLISYLPAGLPRAAGDGPRVEQVLTNFLHAACKLTPPGGQIRVEVRQQGETLFCEVQDGGPTLSEDQISQALERFAQLGGTWLGLSVSKRLIEAQGGSLGIDARPGTGNAFWFHLPLLTNIK